MTIILLAGLQTTLYAVSFEKQEVPDIEEGNKKKMGIFSDPWKLELCKFHYTICRYYRLTNHFQLYFAFSLEKEKRKSSCICWNMSWDTSQISWALAHLWACHHSLNWQSISRACVSCSKGRRAAEPFSSDLMSMGTLKMETTAQMPSSLFRENDKVAAVVALRKIDLNSQICFKQKLQLPLFLTEKSTESREGKVILLPASWLTGNHRLQPILFIGSQM